MNMKSRRLQLLLMSALIGPAVIALGDGATTRPASPAIADVTGTVRRPVDLGDAKAAVVIFISTDCPICNGYAPEINRMCREYEAKGVLFYLVHGDRDLSDASAKKHASDYGFTCPVLIDRKHELVRWAGATVTPEAAVIGPGGLLYRGRIDDLYPALGKRRYEATTHDLRQALDAMLAGKPVAAPRTSAVGCAITD